MAILTTGQVVACGECIEEDYGEPVVPLDTGQKCDCCGASDDGMNCWDCGVSSEDEDFLMCVECGHSLCWDCTGGVKSNYYSPHRSDRCGSTAPVWG